MSRFATIAIGALIVLALGFYAWLENDSIQGVLWMATVVVAIVTIVLAARSETRIGGAATGAAVGVLTAVMWWEGRWLAYLSGWNGLEMDRFLSATGDSSITAADAQILVFLVGFALGVPYAIAGCLIGLLVGWRSELARAAAPPPDILNP